MEYTDKELKIWHEAYNKGVVSGKKHSTSSPETKKFMEQKGTRLAVMAKDIEYIKKEVEDINHKLEGQYVTKVEFDPVKKLVYGLVAVILIAVIGGLMTLLLK